MIDIKLIRNDPELVKENIRKKFQEEKLPLVDEVFAMDKEFREAKTTAKTWKWRDSASRSCPISRSPTTSISWKSFPG